MTRRKRIKIDKHACPRCGGVVHPVAGLPTCETCGPLSTTGPALEPQWYGQRGHMDGAPVDFMTGGGTRRRATWSDDDLGGAA